MVLPWLLYALVFPRSARIFGLFFLSSSRPFELDICARIRDHLVFDVDFAEIEQPLAHRFPLADGHPEHARHVSGIIGKRPAVQVNQVDDDPVCALQLERHSDRSVDEVARECSIVRKPVHLNHARLKPLADGGRMHAMSPRGG